MSGQLATDLEITDVDVFVVASTAELPLPSWQRGLTRFAVVRVTVACGIQGFGMAESQPEVVRAVVEAEGQNSFSFAIGATLPGLRAAVVGQSAANLKPLWNRMYAATSLYGLRGAALQAISAVDVACTDILARYLGVGVSHLLGGQFRTAVPAYASAVLPSERTEIRDLAAYVSAAGFTALKLGWGAFREDIKTIMPLIEEARACLPTMRLIFDIGYERRRTAAELLELFAELERFDPLWIEDCCHPDDLETYRRLAAHSRAALAAGEAHATPYEFARLIDAGVEILQPDLSRCGGYTVAVQIASLATSANRRVIPHAWLNDLLLAATLQLCAALPDDTYLEYSVAHGPLQRVCSPSLPVLDGQVAVPPGPGIGVTPDPEILDRFSVSVPA